jgi:hypothetical protein
MDINTFVERYKPINNHLSNDHSYFSEDDQEKAFETYGDELDFVLQQDNRYIWTILDDGTVQNGYWLVNRLAYLVCENKWELDRGHMEFSLYEEVNNG